MSLRDWLRRIPDGKELPVTGPWSYVADELASAARSSPPWLYRVLWGNQRPPTGSAATTGLDNQTPDGHVFGRVATA